MMAWKNKYTITETDKYSHSDKTTKLAKTGVAKRVLKEVFNVDADELEKRSTVTNYTADPLQKNPVSV